MQLTVKEFIERLEKLPQEYVVLDTRFHRTPRLLIDHCEEVIYLVDN